MHSPLLSLCLTTYLPGSRLRKSTRGSSEVLAIPRARRPSWEDQSPGSWWWGVGGGAHLGEANIYVSSPCHPLKTRKQKHCTHTIRTLIFPPLNDISEFIPLKT